VAGFTVKVPMVLLSPTVPVTVAVVAVATPVVVAVKVCDVLPAGMVMLAGTVTTDGGVPNRETLIPPAGAGWVIVAVPMELLPPVTAVGLKVTTRGTGAGITVRICVTMVVPVVAVTVTAVEVLTDSATALKVWVLVFAGMSRVAGMDRAVGLLLIRSTVSPPAGALAFRLTVAVATCPVARFVGLKASPATTAGLIVRVLDLRLPFSEAEIMAIVWTATGFDTIAKDVLVALAGTVTVAGTTALTLLLERVTLAPPAGAAPPSVTVPVEPWPPVTPAGEIARELTSSGTTVRGAFNWLFKDAVIVTTVCEVTVVVVTVNVPVVCPAAIGTLDDTKFATVGRLLVSSTTAGVVGARVRVTFPDTVPPLSTLVGGPIVMDCTCAVVGGSTFNAAEAVAVSVAEMLTVVCVVTEKVLIMNVADVWPEGMTTVGLGSDAVCVVSLESVTVAPVEGAAAEMITVPVDICPPSTSDGESTTLVTLGAGGGGVP